MDIYATREELKSRQKNIFDLKLNVRIMPESVRIRRNRKPLLSISGLFLNN